MHDTAVFNEGALQIAAETAALVDQIIDLCGQTYLCSSYFIDSVFLTLPYLLFQTACMSIEFYFSLVQPIIFFLQYYCRCFLCY